MVNFFSKIDFGRAAYTVNNKFIISDSYDLNGDAQKKAEIIVNHNMLKMEPIVNPNHSFDLCDFL